MTAEERAWKIKELKAALARGCAGPEKFARRTIARRMRELKKLEKETK
ncbi:MAG: hypothetical protein V3S71_02825 [Acidobacteriota bacterium]